MKYFLPFVLATLALSACASRLPQPPEWTPSEYRGAYNRICSPVDASGLEYRLEKIDGNGPALVLIQLWGSYPEADQDLIELSGEINQGSLIVCQTEQDCQQLQRGFLLIENRNGRYPSSGQFWSGNGLTHGSFNALPGQLESPICG
jgi:hypothetical protein